MLPHTGLPSSNNFPAAGTLEGTSRNKPKDQKQKGGTFFFKFLNILYYCVTYFYLATL